MGKRKRRHRESHIEEKIKRLERRLAKRRRRRSSSSDSEDSFESFTMEPVAGPSGLAESHGEEVSVNGDDAIPIGDDEMPTEANLTLDEGILEILGSDPTQEKIFGENLHKDIVSRWNHILSNGLSKEDKDGLLKTYLPPENCVNIKSPKLNPEVKAALNDLNAKKDHFSQGNQNQISSCLAALGIALNLALSQPDASITNQDLIKPLSDASRLLCDLQFVESKSRRYCIINTLNKEMRESLKNTKIDEFLFGSELSEHIKYTKAITKSGSELRLSRTRMPNGPRTLNAMGAQRAPVAQPRTNPYVARQPPLPTPPQRSALPPPPPPPRGRRTQHSTRPRHYNAPIQQRALRGRRH